MPFKSFFFGLGQKNQSLRIHFCRPISCQFKANLKSAFSACNLAINGYVYGKQAIAELKIFKLRQFLYELQPMNLLLFRLFFIYIVCALNGKYSSFIKRIPKGCKSRMHGRSVPKQSKWQGGFPWGMHWSKPDCVIGTDEQEPDKRLSGWIR